MLALMADGLMVLIRKYTRYYYYSAGKTDELIAIQRGIVWENRSLTAAYLLNFTLGESLISLSLSLSLPANSHLEEEEEKSSCTIRSAH